MYRVTLDLWQDDCPLTQASANHDVEFITPYWNYSPKSQQWDLWVESSSAERAELESGIRALRDAKPMQYFELKQKNDTHATLQVRFDKTDAITAITTHGGAVVGPFMNYQGRERWHLGFTSSSAIDTALSKLGRYEEFSVVERTSLGTQAESSVYRHFNAASEFITACRQLSETERRVLYTAFEHGYYETPREETLASLGERCGVSDAAISKALRRAERKLIGASITSLTPYQEPDEMASGNNPS
jgi:predicted DNA binding protein